MRIKRLYKVMTGLVLGVAAVSATASTVMLKPNITGFNAINLHDSGKVILRQGAKDSISMQVPQRAVPYMNVYRSGKTLNLRMKDHPFNLSTQPIYTITMQHIQGITDSNSGNVHVLSSIHSQRIAIVLKNSGYIQMRSLDVNGPASVILHNSGHIYINNMRAKNASLYLANSGSIQIESMHSNQLSTTLRNSGHVQLNQGQVQQENLSLTNSGTYKAHGVVAKNASVVMRNSGQATISVTGHISLRKRGSGKLFIFGHPRIDKFDVKNASGIIMKS